jgi:limonene-1,2-epoxide hydrolase
MPAQPSKTMNTKEIAERLVTCCREAKWEAAQKELYADDAVSIEAQASPAFAKETKGLAAIIEKGHKFDAMIDTMHSLAVSEPLVADNSFVCAMSMDVTMKGPGRVKMTELCVYQVKDGKIVSEQFHM